MQLKDYILRQRKIYRIVDPDDFDSEDNFLNTAAQELEKGADIMELKTTNSNASKLVKYGKKLRELCSIYNALFIVRSRADIGHILQADGISLEPGDIDINSARHLLGEQSIAGFFVYTKDDMEKALREKADFIVLFSELSDTVLSEYNNFFIPIFKITEINV